MRIKLHYSTLLLALSPLIQSLPTGDIRSLHGLTHVTRDRSGKQGDHIGKYFHESTFDPHYDGRFAETTLAYEDRRSSLSALLRTYLSTMHDIGTETWLMHGSLLGWWWNRLIMPWDSDIDVQMTESSLEYLASYYNMTVHHFNIPGVQGSDSQAGRDYLLEINPHYKNSSTSDILNVIDARWIDMSTGLFIDITALRRNRVAETNKTEGQMMCKDRHTYLAKNIFPLRDSIFENVPVKVPYAYAEVLEQEYGRKALTVTKYEGHIFEKQTMEWKPNTGSRGARSSRKSNSGRTPSSRPSSEPERHVPKAGQVDEVHHASESRLDI